MTDQPKTSVDVPAGLMVECPLVQKRLRRVSGCPACEHFAGMLDQFPGADYLPFSKRYSVACRFPFARATFELVEDADAGPQS